MSVPLANNHLCSSAEVRLLQMATRLSFNHHLLESLYSDLWFGASALSCPGEVPSKMLIIEGGGSLPREASTSAGPLEKNEHRQDEIRKKGENEKPQEESPTQREDCLRGQPQVSCDEDPVAAPVLLRKEDGGVISHGSKEEDTREREDMNPGRKELAELCARDLVLLWTRRGYGGRASIWEKPCRKPVGKIAPIVEDFEKLVEQTSGGVKRSTSKQSLE